MKTPFLGQVAIGALATTLLMVGCNPGGGSHVASAGSKPSGAAAQAAEYAALGETAMRGRNGPLAVAMAERAVAAQPEVVKYRSQLGQSYLMAGRFASAIDAFRDTIALTPEDGRAYLGMALAQGALDRQAAAEASVAAAAGRISDVDRGLALALAGVSDAAIALLEPAARAPDAVPKTRQNLALAYALAGRWDVARATAAQDLSGADLDARMAKWAQLARPQARVDRVASFLGVIPVAIDEGMPMQLALGVVTTPDTAPIAVAAADPVIEVPPAMADSAPVAVAMQTVAEPVADGGPALVRAPESPKARPLLMRATYVVPPKRGLWAVQLGAFSSGHSIEEAWDRVRRVVHPVAGMMPLSSTVRARGSLFQRLAVGGIESRAAAVTLCEQVRRARGVCFVRTVTDEAPVRMAAKAGPVRLAAR